MRHRLVWSKTTVGAHLLDDSSRDGFLRQSAVRRQAAIHQHGKSQTVSQAIQRQASQAEGGAHAVSEFTCQVIGGLEMCGEKEDLAFVDVTLQPLFGDAKSRLGGVGVDYPIFGHERIDVIKAAAERYKDEEPFSMCKNRIIRLTTGD
jgi:hypothetical protein